MKFTNQKRTYLELAMVKMSDYLEQISVDNSALIQALEEKITKLEAKLNNMSFVTPVKEVIKSEEVKVVEKRNTEYNFVEVDLIENVLNNGNVKKKKVLISKVNEIKTSTKERLVANNFANAAVVASSETECIITFPQTYLCDFMMQKANKAKVLSLINTPDSLIKDYYAIPANVWESILQDYTTQFKSGIKKPQLAHINIDVRLYNEEEKEEESEIVRLAHDFFGENVSFE